jgi:DNA-binding CsgD family transcriptional regulator
MPDAKLSAREQEVAGLIMQGFTYTQIGEELCISPNTVKSHWTRIYTKLGINTRRELFTTLKQPRELFRKPSRKGREGGLYSQTPHKGTVRTEVTEEELMTLCVPPCSL